MEHPSITKKILTGYPKGYPKDEVETLEDEFGDEIEEGEEYYVVDSRIVKKENLLDFLESHMDFYREIRGEER